MKTTKFRKNPLAAAMLFALGSVTYSAAMAQDSTGDAADNDDETAEETVDLGTIEVSGIRGSLMRAMDRKREAKGVVDAITSEDIGNFPDQNLAEALQRIPGVSISRVNNEGSQITVRGLGPEFNLVTLNGRTMPTQGSRSFDFNDLASFGISAVEVIKTGRADLPTGGIGATVNILTARPLDNPGFRAAVLATAVHETSSSDGDLGDLDEITPELAGIYSQTFADDTIGIALTGSWQVRDNREEFAEVDSWRPSDVSPLNGGPTENNNQRADGIYWRPQNAGYGFADISRERINGQATLQWAPSERLKLTLDYTYSELDFEADRNSFGIWFENPTTQATVNERGTVTSVTQIGGDYAVNVARDHTIKENNSLGFNVEWQATDSLGFELDAHSSSSSLEGGGLGDGVPGSSANLIVGNTFCDWCGTVPGAGPTTATIDEKTAFYPGSGIPIWGATFRDQATGEMLDFVRRSDMGSLFGQAFDVDNENDITQIQLRGVWQNQNAGALSSIDFGLNWTDQEFVNRNAFSGLLPAGFWLTSAQYWPDEIWEERSFSGLLGNFGNAGNFPTDRYFVTNFGNIVDIYETIDCTNDPVGCGVYWPSWGPEFQDPSGDRGFFWSGPLGNASGSGITEEMTAAYLQVNFEDEFNGMWYNARFGLRVEDTQVTSTGNEVPATAVVWVGGDEFITEYGPPTFVSETSSETEFLPSVYLDLEIVEDVIGRFAYSRTLSRPPIGALSPVRSFVGNPRIGNREASSGNPDLQPYLSDNFDLSLEWYYAPGSYASIGYFYKSVDNFLEATTVEETFPDILDPYIGAQAELARQQLAEEGIPLTNANVFERINENLGVPATTPVRAQPGDPPVVWSVSTTRNAQEGDVYGWELQLQHMFGYSGFGVQLNATFVDGDVEADRDVVGRQFALAGLSDSYNVIGFYQNSYISARLAYNYRDEFLSGFDQFDSPIFVEDYGQLDLNLTWYATENLSVFFEGLNVTEETQRVYVRYPEQFVRGNQYGARYNLGARWQF